MTNIMDENMGNLDIFYNEEKYSLMINININYLFKILFIQKIFFNIIINFL